MRRLLLTALALGLMVSQAPAQQPAPAMKDLKQKVSYIVGMNMGNTLKSGEIDLDPALLVRGLQDALAGVKPPLSEEEIAQTMQAFEQEMIAKNNQQAQNVGTKNKEEGDAFMAQNKTRPGVVTLPSGLQYRVLRAGNGPSPKGSDTVAVNYKGSLLNGTEFDSSYKRGTPATFRVDGVIPGWTEALQLMKVGDKWELVIPSSLAYGPSGAGGLIGPNATLVFEVELLSVQ
jgi:FKBP-type peptidyl-prolyl cis-trans isomerase FklB